MTFLSYLKDAWSSIIANKLRSALTMLGIVIGVSSVVIMMAVGVGVQQSMLKQMSSLINNNITISTRGGFTTYTNDDIKGYVKAITLTPELAEEIESAFPELSGAVTYGVTLMGMARNGNNSSMGAFAGVPIDYVRKMGLTLEYGRNFDQIDFDTAAEVAIINKNTSESLFGVGSYPIGEKVTYNNKDYTVIGMLSDSNIMGQVLIPLATYRQKVSGNRNITAITVKLAADADNTLWQGRINYFLLRKFDTKHLDLAGFSLSSTAAIGNVLESTMAIFTVFLWIIGGISLLVGGIGVMNIMLVSVTERTREIWIRKAVGALNKDIIQQFLIESVVITSFGGALAIGFSFGVQYLVNRAEIAGMTGTDPLAMYVTTSVMITAITVTFLVGILAGILPAKRAANLKPIDALRFE